MLGIPLVEGSDLYIGHNGRVWGRCLDGDFEVDLVYRRVEDLELFVPGLTEAYLNHKVVLVNAMGTGACDDKLVFLWVPDMIKAYLGIEQPQVFITQETLDFSQHLVFDETGGEFEERHVDLRVFAVQNGRGEVTVFPGGLTRVSEANRRVTNDSSGGSCKPTWVVR